MKRKAIVSIVSSVVLLSSAVLMAKPVTDVIFSAVDQSSYRPLYAAIFNIIDAHADTLSIQLSYMPNVRQLTAIEDGKVDGIGIRTDGAEDSERLLLKAEPRLFEAHSVIAIPKDAKDIADRSSLEGLKIGVLNGSAHCRNVVPQDSVFAVNSHASGLKMVAAKRVDAMCILDLAYYATLVSTPELSEKVRIARWSPKVTYSLYIHPRRQSLLPVLESALRKSTEHDQLQRVYDRIIDDLKKQASVLRKP